MAHFVTDHDSWNIEAANQSDDRFLSTVFYKNEVVLCPQCSKSIQNFEEKMDQSHWSCNRIIQIWFINFSSVQGNPDLRSIFDIIEVCLGCLKFKKKMALKAR